MQEVLLKDNFKCKYPNSNPVNGECKLNKLGLCDKNCLTYGVCESCFYHSPSIPSNECLECHFYETIQKNPNLIQKDIKAEHDMIKAVKEKDGYINGNNIER